ncbi:hypothetical protein [Pseudoalteromonas lipolytica]|uniref:hypothetical protein n=1 Tax=Pseudoalteromonas lipolytica TaxID=570156 RepID=UPI00241FE372|nr:hypothetical protein [Pseudoalteromonas lipolytica]|tara:strand:+ start:2431 stop:3729 length:1299 start_codon:yes stop_codon:yes gene_type:complete
MPVREIILPGKQAKEGIVRLTEYMKAKMLTRQPFEPRSIFTFLKLEDVNKPLQDKLTKRAPFLLADEQPDEPKVRYISSDRRNLTENIREVDDSVGTIRLTVPKKLSTDCLLVDHAFRAEFPLERFKRIILKLQKAPIPGAPKVYVCKTLEIDSRFVTYLFQDKFSLADKNEKKYEFALIWDMELDPDPDAELLSENYVLARKIFGSDQFREGERIKSLKFADCPCSCCKLGDDRRIPNCPASDDQLELSVHVRWIRDDQGTVVEPDNTIEEQIAALNTIFQAENANMVARLVSEVVIQNSAYVHMDVAECRGPSDHIIQLFEQYHNKNPQHIFVFFCNTITSSTGHTLLGCAADPRGQPGCVMRYNTNGRVNVMAHEIGHILGLNHYERTEDNEVFLMYPEAVEFPETPLLSNREVRTIRCSSVANIVEDI